MATENPQAGSIEHDPVTGEVLENPAAVDAISEYRGSDTGQVMETIITPKSFLPPGADTDPKADPRKLVALEKNGTRIMLGALGGTITRIERKTKEWEGKELSSVWLHGKFEAHVYATDETVQAPVAILPRAYGDMIENAFRAAMEDGQTHGLRARLDVEVGVKASGGAIPFNWCILNFEEDESDRALREIRTRQKARLARRQQAAQLAGPAKLKAIGSK
jgi:hypothetical protein